MGDDVDADVGGQLGLVLVELDLIAVQGRQLLVRERAAGPRQHRERDLVVALHQRDAGREDGDADDAGGVLHPDEDAEGLVGEQQRRRRPPAAHLDPALALRGPGDALGMRVGSHASQRLIREALGFVEVAAGDRDVVQQARADGDADEVVGLQGQADALERQRTGLVEAPLHEPGAAQHHARHRALAIEPDLPEDVDRLHEHGRRADVIPLPGQPVGEPRQHPRVKRCARAPVGLEDAAQKTVGLVGEPARLPRPAQGHREALRELDPRPRPLHGLAQVQDVVDEPPGADFLLRRKPPRGDALGQREEELEVAIAGPVGLPGFDQLVAGVLAEGLEERVADLGAVDDVDERLVDELSEQIDDVDAGDGGLRVWVAAHRADGREGAWPGEDGETREQGLLGRRQERVAPVDERAQGLLTWQGRAAAAGEQAKTIVEARAHLGDAERTHPRRGELEGQGHAVETGADLADGERVVAREHEGRIGGAHAIDEQSDRIEGGGDGDDVVTGGFEPLRAGRRQGIHAARDLAIDAEGLTAGGQHAHAGCSTEQLFDDDGALPDQVLAVVEDEQQALALHVVEDALAQRLSGRCHHAQRLRRACR